MKQSVIQLGYVTRDLQSSIDYWVDVVGAGPFFSAEYAPDGQLFRGRPTDTRFKLVYGYAGDSCIEIIQQTNDAPSAYTELLDSRSTVPKGGLFHHVMVTHQGYDEAYERYLAAGASQCFDARAPGVERYCYLDARRLMDCYVEMLEFPQAFEEACVKMREAHRIWDGRNPVRLFKDLFAS